MWVEDAKMWVPASVIDASIQKRDNISNEEAIKMYSEMKDTREEGSDIWYSDSTGYEVGEVGDYKGVMNPKMFDRLTADQQNRIDPARMSEGFVEEEVGQTQEFTDDSEFVIFDDEFIDPEVLAQELAAQNAEAAAMSGQEVQELGSIPTQEAPATPKTELGNLVNEWLQTPEGSLKNQTAEQSAGKFAIEYAKRNKLTEGLTEKQVKKQAGSLLFGTVAQGLNVMQTVQQEIENQSKQIDSRQFELSALEAEERALLKEEAELRNSLNKEDENCAT
jgi:hypothetical protein